MTYDHVYLTYGLIAIVLVLTVLLIRVQTRLSNLLSGKDAKTLEDSIVANRTDIEKLKNFQKESIGHLLHIEKRLKRSIQAVDTVRFNPFKGNGEGGNQSFSTSFVSESGKGVVISSLYSRDRVSVFSKPLENFESPLELTEEERAIIDASKKSLQ